MLSVWQQVHLASDAVGAPWRHPVGGSRFKCRCLCLKTPNMLQMFAVLFRTLHMALPCSIRLQGRQAPRANNTHVHGGGNTSGASRVIDAACHCFIDCLSLEGCHGQGNEAGSKARVSRVMWCVKAVPSPTNELRAGRKHPQSYKGPRGEVSNAMKHHMLLPSHV